MSAAKHVLFPLFVSAITAALIGYSLSVKSIVGAYAALIIGATVVATIYMSADVEADERDIYNAGRAALATIKALVTLGIVVGAWLAVLGYSEGLTIALVSIFSAVLWFILYSYYSWRDIS